MAAAGSDDVATKSEKHKEKRVKKKALLRVVIYLGGNN